MTSNRRWADGRHLREGVKPRRERTDTKRHTHAKNKIFSRNSVLTNEYCNFTISHENFTVRIFSHNVYFTIVQNTHIFRSVSLIFILQDYSVHTDSHRKYVSMSPAITHFVNYCLLMVPLSRPLLCCTDYILLFTQSQVRVRRQATVCTHRSSRTRRVVVNNRVNC